MADDVAPDRRAGARRSEVLRLIRAERDGIGVRALSEATGMHENTIRFHLRRLVDDGLVARRSLPAETPGRPPLVFVATEGVGHEGPGNYALIAQVLSQGLAEHGADAVEAATEYGRQWGRARGETSVGAAAAGARARAGVGVGVKAGETVRDQAVAAVLRVLTETGFEPDIVDAEDVDSEEGEGEAVVQVHNCPFRLLAEEDQAVPCGVHRGIMEGVLESVGAEGAVTELEPFVTAHLCLARVSFPG